MMSKRFRSRHGRSKKEFYVVRNALGQIVSVSNIGRSIRADARIKAKTVVSKRGKGHLGDYKTGKMKGGML